ncbi:hypothetical protein CEXT_151011 [Caerostris extrusa]|uniref:Uncharacterized protein n=1 Tax=Caerostris extrusa TaxID=172846 RepID=A0AAV4MA03_CAEEX|nr:hypothetical protein CEXT_151011 [Caerostris extrusa]
MGSGVFEKKIIGRRNVIRQCREGKEKKRISDGAHRRGADHPHGDPSDSLLEKPKPKYRKDFRGCEAFPRTWKERLLRISPSRGGRRIVSFFKTDADFPTPIFAADMRITFNFWCVFSPITA